MKAFLVVLAVCAATYVAAKDTTLCHNCLRQTSDVSPFLANPSLANSLVGLSRRVCSSSAANVNKCNAAAAQLVPSILNLLSVSATPQLLCSDANVCGAVSKVAERPECSVCQYVLTQVKALMADPSIEAAVLDAAAKACSILPADFSADCNTFLDEYIDEVFVFVAELDVVQSCTAASFCTDPSQTRVSPPVPSAFLAIHSAYSDKYDQSNSVCDNCKLAAVEIHSLVTNPDIQTSLVQYFKDMCAQTGSWAADCSSAVDQYAPVVFQTLAEQLDPDVVCVEVGMCPPSLWQRLAAMPGMIRSWTARRA